MTDNIEEKKENTVSGEAGAAVGFSLLMDSLLDAVKEEQVKLGYRRELIRLYYPMDSVMRMLDIVGSDKAVCLKEEMADSADVNSSDDVADVSCSNDAGRHMGASADRDSSGRDYAHFLQPDCSFSGSDSERPAMTAAVKLHTALEAFAAYAAERIGELRINAEPDGRRICFRLSEAYSEYVHDSTPQSGFIYDFISVMARHGSSLQDVLEVFHRYSGKVHFEELRDNEFDYLVYFEDGCPDSYRYCITEEAHHLIYHRFSRLDYEALGIGR